MGFFSKFKKKTRPEIADAKRIYDLLMAQSRNPGFYGPQKIQDNYEGRVDVLTLHMSLLMNRLDSFGQDGTVLSQALFDQMVDDFNIALREEGLWDSGVKRRIKPMIRLFYTRLKIYKAILNAEKPAELADSIALNAHWMNNSPKFIKRLTDYLLKTSSILNEMDFDQIVAENYIFPQF